MHQTHSSRWLLARRLLTWLVLHAVLYCAQARSAYDEIYSNPELSEFRQLLKNDTILEIFMKQRGVTVFAPTNQAIQVFRERNPQQNAFSKILVNYHISNVAIKREQFPNTVNSMQGELAPLYVSVSPFAPNSLTGSSAVLARQRGDKFYYANNAFILEAHEDLKSEHGNLQVVYILDEVLSAYFPKESTTPPNALELIKNPSLYELGGLDLSNFVRAIEKNQMDTLFSQPGLNTFFVPSRLPLPGAPDFDQYVVKAHVIRNKAFFVRTLGDKQKHETMAFDGKVDVELSLINLTSRFSPEKVYYVQTNTVKNDATHKAGKVLSRLALANIPVKNGIIHIIDKPLMLMDMSVRDFLRNQSKLNRFHRILERHQDILSEISRNLHKTILAPDDNAFKNLMNNNLNFSEINENSEEMKKLLRQHIVLHSVSSTDLKKANNHAVHQSAGGVSVEFRLVGQEPNQRLTVESGGVNATSTQSDFGASDGILHIIDRVLGMPFNTLREKMRTHLLLKETDKISEQGWASKLEDENKRYTFFAPSDQAWLQFAKENPSEFKQLDGKIYPSISRAILDRHLSAKGQFNERELISTVKKIDTIQGELIISPDPKTNDIYVEWEGKRAKVIERDILGLNGVIHVIDTVLAKRRDFVVSAASVPSTNTNCLSVALATLIAAFLLHH